MSTIAADIMSTELILLRNTSTIEEAIRILINNRITGLPVVDRENRMVGILSEYDILNQLNKHKNLKPEYFREPIQYSKNALSVTTTSHLDEIVQLFIDKKVRRLPVVDKDKLLKGIITRRDLMRVFYYRAQLT